MDRELDRRHRAPGFARRCQRAAHVVRGLYAGALGAALLLAARATEAAAPSARLLYRLEGGAERCPSEVDLRDVVAERLGYDPFVRDAETIVTVVVAEEPEGLRGTIEHLDAAGVARGRREIRSANRDCRDLADAMALSIALLLDPQSAFGTPRRRPPRPTPARPEPAAANEAPPPDVGAIDVKPAPPAPRITFRGGLGALGSVGAAPAPALGFEVFAGMESDRWGLDLEGRADLPASTSPTSGVSVRSSLLLGALAPWYRVGYFRLCVVAALGSLRGEGVDVQGPRHESAFYAALGARLALELPLGRWLGLRAHVDLLAPLTRATLTAAGEDLWTTPPLAGSFGGGPFVHFQ